jgi:hypothetical protein
MKPDKPLKDCFLCSICKEAPGFMPPWDSWIPGSQDVRREVTQPLMCKRCIKAFARVKSHSGAHVEGLHVMLAWAAKRAREAEHKRMTDKLNAANYNVEVLQRKVFNLNRLIESKEILCRNQTNAQSV